MQHLLLEVCIAAYIIETNVKSDCGFTFFQILKVIMVQERQYDCGFSLIVQEDYYYYYYYYLY